MPTGSIMIHFFNMPTNSFSLSEKPFLVVMMLLFERLITLPSALGSYKSSLCWMSICWSPELTSKMIVLRISKRASNDFTDFAFYSLINFWRSL